jgi:hypothetical protein
VHLSTLLRSLASLQSPPCLQRQHQRCRFFRNLKCAVELVVHTVLSSVRIVTAFVLNNKIISQCMCVYVQCMHPSICVYTHACILCTQVYRVCMHAYILSQLQQHRQRRCVITLAANTAGAGANKSNAPGSYQQLLMAESYR